MTDNKNTITLPKLDECKSLNEGRKIEDLKLFKSNFKEVVAPILISIIKKALIEFEAGPNKKKICFPCNPYANNWGDMQIYENHMGDCRMNDSYRQFAQNTINEQLKDSEWRVTKIKDYQHRWHDRRFEITVVHNTYEAPPKRCNIL